MKQKNLREYEKLYWACVVASYFVLLFGVFWRIMTFKEGTLGTLIYFAMAFVIYGGFEQK